MVLAFGYGCRGMVVSSSDWHRVQFWLWQSASVCKTGQQLVLIPSSGLKDASLFLDFLSHHAIPVILAAARAGAAQRGGVATDLACMAPGTGLGGSLGVGGHGQLAAVFHYFCVFSREE